MESEAFNIYVCDQNTREWKKMKYITDMKMELIVILTRHMQNFLINKSYFISFINNHAPAW